MEILSPVAEKKMAAAEAVFALDDIHGKVIGFLENGWRSGGLIIDRLQELFQSEQDVRTYRQKTETSGPDEKKLYDDVAQNCDAVVVLIAN
jgi:hypothetical protein